MEDLLTNPWMILLAGFTVGFGYALVGVKIADHLSNH